MTLDPFVHVTPSVGKVEYAVRGPIVAEANRMRDAIDAAVAAGRPSPFPFSSIVYCNVGNPQAVGQSPMSYVNEGLAYFHNPQKATDREVSDYVCGLLPSVRRGANGAYTDSAGFAPLRTAIANAITTRDAPHISPPAPACQPASIILTDGASNAAKLVLQVLLGTAQDAMLIPIPLYPLYTALPPLLPCRAFGYHLSASNGWRPTADVVAAAYERARKEGCTPRILVMINPGNPTGAVIAPDEQVALLRLCETYGMTLLADEVYQENVYGDVPFRSFRAAALAVGSRVPVVSLHSASKGFVGECGRRGGLLQLHNVRPPVEAAIQKLASVCLCANIAGQLLMAMVMCPPTEKVAPRLHATYERERAAILADLRRKATRLHAALNAIPHMSCAPIEGAMYAFPAMSLPPAFVASAGAGQAADVAWAMGLLREKGIVVVPGTGFGMPRDGSAWYFRITILPTASTIDRAVAAIEEYHKAIWAGTTASKL